jgi:hypothetical protein
VTLYAPENGEQSLKILTARSDHSLAYLMFREQMMLSFDVQGSFALNSMVSV